MKVWRDSLELANQAPQDYLGADPSHEGVNVKRSTGPTRKQHATRVEPCDHPGGYYSAEGIHCVLPCIHAEDEVVSAHYETPVRCSVPTKGCFSSLHLLNHSRS
jgi:hypothetical protein